MSSASTMLQTIQPHNFGGTERGPVGPQRARVALVKDYGDLEFLADEELLVTARVLRLGNLGAACSVDWIIEGTGANPLTAAHFIDGVFPGGTAPFGPSDQDHTFVFGFIAQPEPAVELTGRIRLDNPSGCEINPAGAEISILVRAKTVTTEPVLSLTVPFTELVRDVDDDQVFTITGNRAENTSGAVGCPWRIVGTGSNPATGAYFSGGVLPSGTFSWADGVTADTDTFTFTAGAKPDTPLTGRIELHTPTGGAVLDPANFSRDITIAHETHTVSWGLGPDWSVSWVRVADGDGDVTAQHSNGVTLTGGTKAGGFENGVALVSKQVTAAPFRLTFTVTKLDSSTADSTNDELFLLLGLGLKGVGGNPQNLALWNYSGVVPGSHYFRDRTRGGRLTLFFQSNGNNGENDKLPAFAIFDAGSTSHNLLPDQDWTQSRNTSISYQIDVNSSTVTVQQTIGATVKTASVTHADIGTKLTGGNILLLCNAARSVKIEDLDVEPLTTPVGSWDLVEANFSSAQCESGDASRLTWIPGGGFEIAGAANTDAKSLAIWWKTPLPDHYRASFTYVKNEDDAAADSGGRWANFWHGFIGTTNSVPADVSTWTSSHWKPSGYSAAADSVYGDQGKGGRISFDTESTVSGNRNEARDVQWDEGTDNRLTPTPDPPSFPMSGASSSYDIDITRQGGTLTIENLTAGDEVSWSDSTILLPGGRGGFKSGRGRGFKILPRSGTPIITALSAPGGGTEWPHGEWRKMPSIPNSGSNRKGPFSSTSALNTALANAQDGDFFLLDPTASLTGTINITKGLSNAETGGRYWITSNTDADDPAAFSRLDNATINFNGAHGAVLNGFRYDGGKTLRGPRMTFEDASFCQIERGDIYDCWGSTSAQGTDTGYGDPFTGMTTSDVDNILFGFLRYRDNRCSFFDAFGRQTSAPYTIKPKKFLLTHIHLLRNAYYGRFMNPGRHPNNGIHDMEVVAQYCLEQDSARLSDWCELKFNGVTIRHNTFEMYGKTHRTDSNQIKIRHGRLGSIPASSSDPQRGCLIEGNLFVRPASTSRVTITLRGKWHKVINNWAQILDENEEPGVGKPDANLCQIWCYGAQSDAKTFPENGDEAGGMNRRMNIYGAQVGGNRGWSVVSTWDNSTHNYKPEACTVPESGQSRNTSVDKTGGAGWKDCTFGSATISGANYDQVPRRLRAADVGPRAWRSTFNPE